MRRCRSSTKASRPSGRNVAETLPRVNAAAGRGAVAGRGAADAAASLPKGRLEEQIPDGKPTYLEGEAVAEANRCLYCHDAPCIEACPTGIDIPRFIRKISTGNTRGSASVILSANLLGY